MSIRQPLVSEHPLWSYTEEDLGWLTRPVSKVCRVATVVGGGEALFQLGSLGATDVVGVDVSRSQLEIASLKIASTFVSRNDARALWMSRDEGIRRNLLRSVLEKWPGVVCDLRPKTIDAVLEWVPVGGNLLDCGRMQGTSLRLSEATERTSPVDEVELMSLATELGTLRADRAEEFFRPAGGCSDEHNRIRLRMISQFRSRLLRAGRDGRLVSNWWFETMVTGVPIADPPWLDEAGRASIRRLCRHGTIRLLKVDLRDLLGNSTTGNFDIINASNIVELLSRAEVIDLSDMIAPALDSEGIAISRQLLDLSDRSLAKGRLDLDMELTSMATATDRTFMYEPVEILRCAI